MGHARAFTPRLMPAPAAAHYLGVSESKLRTLGIPRRIHDGNRLYHVVDLDAWADSLPIEGIRDLDGTKPDAIDEPRQWGRG